MVRRRDRVFLCALFVLSVFALKTFVQFIILLNLGPQASICAEA